MSDLIDRQELIQELQMMKYKFGVDSITKLQNHEIDRCIEAIQEAKPVQAQQTVIIPPEVIDRLAKLITDMIAEINWTECIKSIMEDES